jgi:hypothetical protein
MFFNYEHLQFRYEPFPIGRAIPFLDESTYGDMVDNFPPIDIFESFQAMGKKGEKYTLSQKENPKTYGAFVQSSPVWREFHAWIKSDDFVYELLDTLKERNIDLGYRQASPICRLIKTAKSRFKGKGSSGRHVPLRARFEFSALPADGGCLPPHTDAPTKIATIIVSMLKEGEWNPAFGGGTDVNQGSKPELQPSEPCGRLRRHGGDRHLRFHAEPGCDLRQDLQLLAFGAPHDGPWLGRLAPNSDRQHRAAGLVWWLISKDTSVRLFPMTLSKIN